MEMELIQKNLINKKIGNLMITKNIKNKSTIINNNSYKNKQDKTKIIYNDDSLINFFKKF